MEFSVCCFKYMNRVFVILDYRGSRCWQEIFLGIEGVYGAQWPFTCSVCIFLWVLEACLWLLWYCMNLFLIHRLRWVHLIRKISNCIITCCLSAEAVNLWMSSWSLNLSYFLFLLLFQYYFKKCYDCFSFLFRRCNQWCFHDQHSHYKV